MENFILHCEEEPAERIYISAQGIVDQLDEAELEYLLDTADPFNCLYEAGNIFDAEWNEAIRKLNTGRYQLSADDEAIVKQIADKL